MTAKKFFSNFYALSRYMRFGVACENLLNHCDILIHLCYTHISVMLLSVLHVCWDVVTPLLHQCYVFCRLFIQFSHCDILYGLHLYCRLLTCWQCAHCTVHNMFHSFIIFLCNSLQYES